ncbi:MAG: hypothetical protein NUV50_00560 [Rhodospirillales bacterium]|nr:hypothetical protein [Rhodospirillales bacterium]
MGDTKATQPSAKPEKEKTEREKPERERSFENVPSSLDEMTHLELQLLYRESADTVRFAKHIQWWTVSASLIMFFAFIGIAKFVGANMGYAKILTALVIFVAMTSITALVIYQFWQYNEQRKLAEITKNFSSLFKKIRRIKSKGESDVHRYTLLAFMVITVIIGGVMSYNGVLQIATP